MATTIDGVTAPKEGFKQGGWYSGRQYWNGTLSAPGVINSQSDQVGAGQRVSNEVVAQTNPANVAYLEGQNKPSSPAELASNLDKFQQSTFASADVNAPKVATIEELKSKLAPTTAKPAPLNRMEEFTKLTTQQGVADLENQLNSLKAQEQETQAQLRTDKTAERGKPVAMGVIEGRISKETQTAQDNLDFIGRQKAVITDQLNTKYNLISTMMNYMGLDYNDAVKAYDDEYSRNINLYQLVQTEEKTAFDQAMTLRQDAKANLQMFATAITNGNLNPSTMSADQKLMMNKLEIQSGVPVGTIASLQMSPKDKLLNINEKTGEALIVDGSGGFKVVKTGMTPSSSGTGDMTGTQNRAAISEATAIIDKIDAGYNTVDGKMVEQYETKEVIDPVTQMPTVKQVARSKGDTYLSEQEFEMAKKQVIKAVGDATLGEEIFKQAISLGGYKAWQ